MVSTVSRIPEGKSHFRLWVTMAQKSDIPPRTLLADVFRAVVRHIVTIIHGLDPIATVALKPSAPGVLPGLAFAVTPCLWFRSRPYGTYDAIQLKRVKFDRTVFLRHAVPEWRIWRSPFTFLKAYTGTLRHFFDYFVDAAVHRAESGDRRGSTRALIGAFSVFPLRTLYYVIAPKPLRAAVLSIVSPRRGSVFPIEAQRDGD